MLPKWRNPASLRLRNQYLVPFEKLMKEVEVLKAMSGRLDLIAEEHSAFSEALFPISAGILRLATVLEVLIISKSSERPN